MEERKQLWSDHNSLRPGPPMIIISPECGWEELITDKDMQCESSYARGIEWQLRSRIYMHEHFVDDTVVENKWEVPAVIHNSGWGIEEHTHASSQHKGAKAYIPVINGPDDVRKLHYPELEFDEIQTQKNVQTMQELFGDILDVQYSGIKHISFHMMSCYLRWRGLEQTFLDMYMEPTIIHDVMRILTDGNKKMLQFYEKHNLLRLNNDNTYQNTGGNGYTDQLPADGFNASRVRYCDMWGSAESQEMAPVGPEQHWEFAMQYESELLAPFGITGYGCCEDLTQKLDYMCSLPHMRRISMSPWADVDKCAPRLKGDFIFSWKPHPAHLCGAFNEEKIRSYIAHAIETCMENGCIMEMILKDTHTCENHPERFHRWCAIARECVDAAMDKCRIAVLQETA
jgi:hypothetical protein